MPCRLPTIAMVSAILSRRHFLRLAGRKDWADSRWHSLLCPSGWVLPWARRRSFCLFDVGIVPGTVPEIIRDSQINLQSRSIGLTPGQLAANVGRGRFRIHGWRTHRSTPVNAFTPRALLVRLGVIAIVRCDFVNTIRAMHDCATITRPTNRGDNECAV
jgi:hypothetical protein